MTMCLLCRPGLNLPPHEPRTHFACDGGDGGDWHFVTSRPLTPEECTYMADCEWWGPQGLEVQTHRIPDGVHVVAMRRIREPA